MHKVKRLKIEDKTEDGQVRYGTFFPLLLSDLVYFDFVKILLKQTVSVIFAAKKIIYVRKLYEGQHL